MRKRNEFQQNLAYLLSSCRPQQERDDLERRFASRRRPQLLPPARLYSSPPLSLHRVPSSRPRASMSAVAAASAEDRINTPTAATTSASTTTTITTTTTTTTTLVLSLLQLRLKDLILSTGEKEERKNKKRKKKKRKKKNEKKKKKKKTATSRHQSGTGRTPLWTHCVDSFDLLKTPKRNAFRETCQAQREERTLLTASQIRKNRALTVTSSSRP